mgnify:CR=1 FL=1
MEQRAGHPARALRPTRAHGLAESSCLARARAASQPLASPFWSAVRASSRAVRGSCDRDAGSGARGSPITVTGATNRYPLVATVSMKRGCVRVLRKLFARQFQNTHDHTWKTWKVLCPVTLATNFVVPFFIKGVLNIQRVRIVASSSSNLTQQPMSFTMAN